jgi:hypothetical protein
MMVVDARPMVDAWSIFLQTRSAVTSVRYPWRLDYTIAIRGFDGVTPVSDHYRASFDSSNGAIRVFPISDEQLNAPPPVPHGFDTKLRAAICFGLCAGVSIPVGHPAPYQDLIGEPLVAPTYMFGLRYQNVPYGIKPIGSESSLPIIATVSTRQNDYDATLVGIEPLNGIETYHLCLKPLRKPKDNRLRELWVGVNDYLPRRAVISGNFTMAPLVDVPWTIEFSVENGQPFVTRESTDDTLYLPHRRVVRDAVIAFENISEPGDSIYDRPLLTPAQEDDTLMEPQV